jgi:hypothetical protein
MPRRCNERWTALVTNGRAHGDASLLRYVDLAVRHSDLPKMRLYVMISSAYGNVN